MTTEEYKREASRLRVRLNNEAGRYLNDADEAEDIVQDAMMKLWTMCNELKMPIDALARTLVRNLCIDRIRRRKHTADISLPDIVCEDVVQERHEQIERMMKIVDKLPSAQQTVLRLRHLQGMEISDIAAMTGCSEAAIRKSLSRARQAVRDKYAEK